MSFYGSKDFMLEIAKGNVPGHSHVNKFGHNPTTNTGDDVWGGGGTYIYYPTAGVAVDMVSTDAADGVGGTGALQVVVIGLGDDWKLQQETATTDGITPVQLTKTYVRLFRAFVYEAGTSNTNIGDITVYARANGSGLTAGDVGIFIGIGGGQTQHTTYTVPADKTAYFVKGYVGLATTSKTPQEGIFRWMMRLNSGVNGAWLTQGEIGLVNTGSGNWQYEYGVPAGPIPEKTDIRIELTTGSIVFDTVGGYDLVLVDN